MCGEGGGKGRGGGCAHKVKKPASFLCRSDGGGGGGRKEARIRVFCASSKRGVKQGRLDKYLSRAFILGGVFLHNVVNLCDFTPMPMAGMSSPFAHLRRETY